LLRTHKKDEPLSFALNICVAFLELSEFYRANRSPFPRNANALCERAEISEIALSVATRANGTDASLFFTFCSAKRVAFFRRVLHAN
jgi:hypothetical protein